MKDLIRARENTHLEDLVLKSYPYVTDHEKIDDCMDRILDYAEDSIPVLSEDKRILGVITSEDLIEMVDNEMGEDYAKLAGLTAEEDLKEPTLQSMKKRLPWLIILLFLGMAVSSVVGLFENVVAVLPIVICFQVPERVKGCQPQQNQKNQIYCVKNPAADRNLDFFRLFPAHQ